MFGFKKKATKEVVTPDQQQLIQLELDSGSKVQVLQHLVLEQRAMIRELLGITTMLAEHRRFELIQVKLHKLANMIDKIK